MRANPTFDPWIETGYYGYALRATAHRRSGEVFQASLEIRDYRRGAGELLYDRAFENIFGDADAALDWALAQGRLTIDLLLEVLNIGETAWA